MVLIAQMVDAEDVQKGKSLLPIKRGERVASPVFNLIDDSLCENGIASFPFDGEGVSF